MMAAALQLKRRVPFPQIASAWLLRWRHDYQVSLRLPNRRWKKYLCTYYKSVWNARG